MIEHLVLHMDQTSLQWESQPSRHAYHLIHLRIRDIDLAVPLICMAAMVAECRFGRSH